MVFSASFLFELRYRFKSLSTWLCFIGLLLMAYREMLAGEWDLLIQSGRVARNSPYTVYYLFMYYTFWAATVGCAIIIPTLLRDIKSGTAEFLYSFPLKDKQYFWGKYCASLITFVFVMSSVAVGFITMPFVTQLIGSHPASDFVSTPWAHIGHAFIIWVLPACFIYGSLTFALTAISGRAAPVYALMMIAVGLFVTITAVYGDGSPKSQLVQILDPLGKVTVEGQLYYWSAEERMTRFLSFEGALLQNRLLYMGIAACVLMFAFFKFDQKNLLQKVKNRNAKTSKTKTLQSPKTLNGSEIEEATSKPVLKDIVYSEPSSAYWLKHAIDSGVSQFGIVLANKAFYFSMLTLALMLILAGFSYETVEFEGSGRLLPKAMFLLPALIYPSLIFTLVAAAFFSIDMCDRDRSYRLNLMVDSCPIPTWSVMLSKIIGVALMAFLLSLIPIASVLVIQFGQGIFETNWSVMFHVLFLVLFPLMLTYGLISIICYGFLQHKTLAQAVAVILCITPAIFNEVKTVENFMYLWAWPFFVQLSDFDASHQYFQRNMQFSLYWLSFYGVLLVIAYWLWPRGTTQGLTARLREAKQRLSLNSGILIAAFLMIFVWSTTSIHSIMIEQNRFQTTSEERIERGDYEKRYSKTRDDVQPKIILANLNVELFPKERSANYSAELTIENRTQQAIRQLVVNLAEFSNVMSLSFNQTQLTPVEIDPVHRRVVYDLPSPLQPDQKALLVYKLNVSYEGFSNNEFDYHGTIVADGTLVDDSFWPTFGYDKSRELKSYGIRRQNGLAPRKEITTYINAATHNSLIGSDNANLIPVRQTIHTDADQIAIGTGNLVANILDNDRATYIYETNQAHYWSPLVASAKYLMVTDHWITADDSQTVDIEVYHHPNHGYNISLIVDAVKLALSQQYEKWGKFPFEILRIVEIPNGMKETKVSGNLIVIPEDKIWLHDYRIAPDIDWITFQIHRDIAKVWWSTVPIADVSGHAVLAKAIPIISGLEGVEDNHGMPALAQLEQIIRDTYLRDRTTEEQEEATLVALNDEKYATNKGVLGLLEVRRILGAEVFNEVISSYYYRTAQKRRAPFGHIGELKQAFLEVVSNKSQRDEIIDLFESTHEVFH